MHKVRCSPASETRSSALFPSLADLSCRSATCRPSTSSCRTASRNSSTRIRTYACALPASFVSALVSCFVVSVQLSVPVLLGLIKYWPITNSSKEVLYLNELEEVLELTQAEEFKTLLKPLFKQISKSIGSPHFQVAERALFLWHNEYISNMIADYRHEVLPVIFPGRSLCVVAWYSISVTLCFWFLVPCSSAHERAALEPDGEQPHPQRAQDLPRARRGTRRGGQPACLPLRLALACLGSSSHASELARDSLAQCQKRFLGDGSQPPPTSIVAAGGSIGGGKEVKTDRKARDERWARLEATIPPERLQKFRAETAPASGSAAGAGAGQSQQSSTSAGGAGAAGSAAGLTFASGAGSEALEHKEQKHESKEAVSIPS